MGCASAPTVAVALRESLTPCACSLVRAWSRAHLPLRALVGSPVLSVVLANNGASQGTARKDSSSHLHPLEKPLVSSAPTPQSRPLYPLVRGWCAQPRRQQRQAARQAAQPLGARSLPALG